MPENARFQNCHNAPMDIEYLVKIKNLLGTVEGKLLMEYAQDYITKQAFKQRDASEIKGMCELIEQFKQIPKKLEEKKRSNQ
jgi:hypothetical protein